jgi:O-antigen/teichoic acid export membrane protein
MGRAVMQLATAIVLARLLNPADYGLMAIALAVASFAALFRDMGTGAGLVQRETIDGPLIGGVLRLNLLVGLLLCGLCVAVAHELGRILGQPRLASVLILLAPSFLIASIGVVPQSLLERDSQFRILARIELVAAMIAALIAITAAIAGFGVYALVAQTVFGAAISTLLLWWRCPWRPSGRGSLRNAQPLIGFSSNLFLFNTLNYAHRNTDSFLIGRFIGATDLGYYSIGYRVILFPLQNLTFVLARVLLPAYSRHQSRPSEVSTHYLRALGMIAFITAPLMATVWAVRECLVEFLLGPVWVPAADVIAWLAPVGLCQSLVSTSGSLLSAFGRTDLLRNLGVIGVPFLIASFVIGLPWGIEGVAAAYCIANVIWVYPVLSSVMRVIGENFQSFLTAVWKPIFVAIAVAGLMRYVGEWMSGSGFGMLGRLTVPLLVGGLSYLLGCRALKVSALVSVAQTFLRLAGVSKTYS